MLEYCPVLPPGNTAGAGVESQGVHVAAGRPARRGVVEDLDERVEVGRVGERDHGRQCSGPRSPKGTDGRPAKCAPPGWRRERAWAVDSCPARCLTAGTCRSMLPRMQGPRSRSGRRRRAPMVKANVLVGVVSNVMLNIQRVFFVEKVCEKVLSRSEGPGVYSVMSAAVGYVDGAVGMRKANVTLLM